MSAGSPLVMHFVFRFAVGGLENGLVNLVNRLPSAEFRHVIVALTDCDREFQRRLIRDDVELIELHKPPGHGWRVFRPVWQLLRHRRPEIVHTRNLAALEMQLPAWAARVPVRIHGEHGRDIDDPDGARFRYRLERRVLGRAVTQFVAVSRDLEQYLVRDVGINARRVTCIRNGVDEERFMPAALSRAPGSLSTEKAELVIGTVGRLQPIKDQRSLIAAVDQLVTQKPSRRGTFRVVLVGDGSLRAQLESEIRDRHLEDMVEILGERNDVPDLMRNMDVFVLPSRAEGISNTVLEAMATGLPVIATDVGGNGELVEDGLTGRLVPPADPAALAMAIEGYLDNQGLARSHGAKGRKRVEQEFSLGAMVERYRSLYHAALDRSASAPSDR